MAPAKWYTLFCSFCRRGAHLCHNSQAVWRCVFSSHSVHQSVIEIVNGFQSCCIQCRRGIRRHRYRPRDATAAGQRARVWFCAVDCHGGDARCVSTACESQMIEKGSQFHIRIHSPAIRSHLYRSSFRSLGLPARDRPARSRCLLLPGTLSAPAIACYRPAGSCRI